MEALSAIASLRSPSADWSFFYTSANSALEIGCHVPEEARQPSFHFATPAVWDGEHSIRSGPMPAADYPSPGAGGASAEGRLLARKR